MKLNAQQFNERKDILKCATCNAIGSLFLKENPNNRGLQVKCMNGCHGAFPGQPFIARESPKCGKIRSKAGETMNETWANFGDRCAHCGTSRLELEELQIGLNRDHQPPLSSVGSEPECSLVPICAWCHELHTANQRAVQRIIASIRRP